MKIVITGGSGFIGTNLMEFYMDKAEVLNIDINSPRNKDHLKYWQKIDIRNQRELWNSLNAFKPDYIIHMAARADLKGETLNDYSSNISGVNTLAETCNYVKSIKRVIFASSMLVCKAGYIPKNDHDYCPPNLYGQSKVMGEEIIKNFKTPFNFDWVIVRPSSIWGPWFGPTYRNFFLMIYKKSYFNISGAMATKTYGYIGNVVYQINQLLLSGNANHCTYYLGDYLPYNIKEWAIEIGEELNTRIHELPSSLVLGLSACGSMLDKLGIRSPLTLFRYKNLRTNNILPLDDLRIIAPLINFSRSEGNRLTIHWMQKTGYIK